MSVFNFHDKELATYEGGAAIEKPKIVQWLNFLLGASLDCSFYERGGDRLHRFVRLTNDLANDPSYGPRTIACMALYARREIGARTASTVVAAVLDGYKFDGKRAFYGNLFCRPDDVAETLAAVEALGGKMSHALAKGARDYLESLDEYRMAKYASLLDGKRYNMHDIINLTHAHSDVIDAYKTQSRPLVADTWERSISACRSAEERESEWRRLVEEDRLGYIAFIRNLRNILRCSWCDESAIKSMIVPRIVDEAAIRGSKVYPYQIVSAAFALAENESIVDEYYRYVVRIDFMGIDPDIRSALDRAFDISVGNMPAIDCGTSCFVIDFSGSMDSPISKMSKMSIKCISTAYAVALAKKSNDPEVILFASTAKRVSIDPNAGILETLDDLLGQRMSLGYSTNMESAVQKMGSDHYDRMFIFSDEQVYRTSDSRLTGIISRKADKVYSFDLGAYSIGCDLFGSDVKLLTSLGDATFKIIANDCSVEEFIAEIVERYSVKF